MAQIRKCSTPDFEQIAALLLQLWPQKAQNLSKLRAVYDRALVTTSQRYICAVDNGDVLGFCSMSIKNSLWEEGTIANIDEFVVDDEARGQGIGSALLEYMIEQARKSGCTRIELDSAFHRTDAHAFYEHKGFEKRAFLFSMEL